MGDDSVNTEYFEEGDRFQIHKQECSEGLLKLGQRKLLWIEYEETVKGVRQSGKSGKRASMSLEGSE